MIAAVLRRQPHQTVRELIALLDKEFRERAATGKLYSVAISSHTLSPISLPIAWSLGRSSKAGVRHRRHATQHPGIYRAPRERAAVIAPVAARSKPEKW
jgi:hypothetical protein